MIRLHTHAGNPQAVLARKPTELPRRLRASLRVSAPLGLAMAVTAALGCTSTDLTGPGFADDSTEGVELTDTRPQADGGDGRADGGTGNGAFGEKW